MATHALHPEASEGKYLADDCDRCRDHSLHPFASLDDEHLLVLYQKCVSNQEARTENEARAMGHMRGAMRVIRLLDEVVRAGMREPRRGTP